MALSHYFYLPHTVSELERLVKSHQDEFEALVGDTFTEEESIKHEKHLDSLAAVYVQPILSELSFDDFYPNPLLEEKQRTFFKRCRSSLCLENIPYFESNPFQVTYLIDLLWSFEEVLIDRGGVQELTFREDYLADLKKYKTMESLLTDIEVRPVEAKSSPRAPVNPIDFLIRDVYKELDRLKSVDLAESSEKMKKIYSVMIGEKDDDASSLLRKTGLGAKDFDDHLEKLKFFLKKIP